MSTLKELLNEIDNINDSYEDLYNKALHELTEEDSEYLTVKEFLKQLIYERTEND